MAFTPIRISTIKSDKALPFDIFIYFKETYLRYTERGVVLKTDQLAKLKKQDVASFYISDEDESNYQQFLDDLLNSIYEDPNTPQEEKVEIIGGTTSNAIENLQKDPTSEASFKSTQKAAKNIRQMLQTLPDVLKNLYVQKTHGDDIIITHSLNVSALATRFAEVYELPEEDLEALSVAGLLHDLGLSLLKPEHKKLFLISPAEMTPEEFAIYKNHPHDSIKLLEKNPLMNPKILNLIQKHEERLGGKGYPEGVKTMTIIEEVLALANSYDKRVTLLKMTPAEAIKDIKMSELGNYNMETLNSFKEVLKKEKLLT